MMSQDFIHVKYKRKRIIYEDEICTLNIAKRSINNDLDVLISYDVFLYNKYLK